MVRHAQEMLATVDGSGATVQLQKAATLAWLGPPLQLAARAMQRSTTLFQMQKAAGQQAAQMLHGETLLSQALEKACLQSVTFAAVGAFLSF